MISCSIGSKTFILFYSYNINRGGKKIKIVAKKTVVFGNREIGPSFPVFIIAEIGTGHRGDLGRAYALVDKAKEAGADCAKFQWVIADEIVHPQLGTMDLPGGPTPLYRKFKALEQPAEFYARCMEYTQKRGLHFLCSVFGQESLRLYQETVTRDGTGPGIGAGGMGTAGMRTAGMGTAGIKIASPEINHLPLLKSAAETRMPVMLSTGMSTLGDIEKALRYLGNELILLHCVTAYPAPEGESNLRVIPLLSAVFDVPAGLSDHSAEPVLAPAAAAALGARVIEKHICLEKGREGLDDTFALPPDEFAVMCRAVRKTESLEKDAALSRLAEEFGEDRVESVLGATLKKVTPTEEGHYLGTRRSVRALTDLVPGTKLTTENSALLRSSGRFKPGVGPEFYEVILGKIVTKPVKAGDGIGWGDLLSEG